MKDGSFVEQKANLAEHFGAAPSGPYSIAMHELVSGRRQGPFVVFEDEDGVRHAVRQGAIMSISEASLEPGATLIQLSGQRTALVRGSFEQVLSWFA